jgi:hypothetical protein
MEDSPTHAARGHGFNRLSDLLAGGLPPLEWLAEGIFTSDALGLVAAPPKALKTWLLLDLVVAAATGADWLGAVPIRRPGPVVLVSPEGGSRSLLRRLVSIAGSLHDCRPEDLEVAWVRTKGVAFTDRRDLADVKAAAAQAGPVLLAIDSLYAGLAGVRTSQLSETGAALRAVQEIAEDAGAAVVLTHHLNRAEGKGLHRVSGAGPVEWASAILIGSVGPRLVENGQTTASINWALTARDVPETSFSVTWRIGADDPADLSSPLHYEVSLSPGQDSALGLSWSEERVHEALGMLGPSGGNLRAINNLLAADGQGKPFKHQTLREVLDRLVAAGLADGADGIWFTSGSDH